MTRLAIPKIGCAVVMLATPSVQAAPVFWLSDSATPGAPRLLDLAVEPNSTGQLYIWANSDVRLIGIDLELVEVGGGVKLTGATVVNPKVGGWGSWRIAGATVDANASAVHMYGDILRYGDGIGAGSIAGDTALFATVDYQSTQVGESSLFLKVGDYSIFGWDGTNFDYVDVHFGTPMTPAVPTYPPGQIAVVGSVHVIPEPSMFLLAVLAISAFASCVRCRSAKPCITASRRRNRR